MVFFENFRIAFDALRANLMRSILTTLGIIIGVAAVISVVSVVQGLQSMITQQFQGVGSNFMMIMPFDRNSRGMYSRQLKLTWDDGKAIRDQVPGISAMTPMVLGQVTLKYEDRQYRPRNVIAGVTEDYPDVNNHFVSEGRFLMRVDLERRRKVAVVGTTVVEELELDNPLGKEMYVGSIPVTIIGVMEEQGQVLGQDSDDVVFLPYDTAVAAFGRNSAEQVFLQLKTADAESVERVRDEARRILRNRHEIPDGEPDDFLIQVQDEILDAINSTLGAVTAVIGAVVGISLIVGGIGIMNIMLVSVTERTREIGIRKSVGARKRDILMQFLIEAVTLSLLGGAIGVALGWGLGSLTAYLIPFDFPPAVVPLWAVALAFGFCTLVGVVFGIYPAGKAASLDPIEALRWE